MELIILAQSSECLTPALARTHFYGKTAPCKTLAFFQATPPAEPITSMTAEWSLGRRRAAEAFALLCGQALPECNRWLLKEFTAKLLPSIMRARWWESRPHLWVRAHFSGPARLAWLT